MDEMMKKPYLYLAAALLLPALSAFSQAPFGEQGLQLPGLQRPHVQVELISEVETIQPGKDFMLGLRLRMDPGWHTYWKNPGASGLPTRIDWTLLVGLDAGELQWPYPEAHSLGGLTSLGYSSDVILLLPMHAMDSLAPGGEVELRADVSWLECSDTACVPGKAPVSLRLPIRGHELVPNKRTAAEFQAARARVPIDGTNWVATGTWADETLSVLLTPPAGSSTDVTRAELYPLTNGLVDGGISASVRRTGDGLTFAVPLVDGADPPQELPVVLVGDRSWGPPPAGRGLAVTIRIGEQDNGPAAGEARPGEVGFGGLLRALLFAFLGGLILNLMPCVFPILSIKIIGFVNQAQEDGFQPWRHGAAFGLGVVVSFWVLAGVLLSLRADGVEIGWGYHLQEPHVVMLLAFLFLFLALSMFGVFELGLSLTRLGGATQGVGGLAGSFLSGALATIVATPCTAPFMGAALLVALAQPTFVALLIFTFLGLGMAAPYVVLSSHPRLMKYVPRPGPWMESLKQFMGFLLLATVAWLVWVMAVQSGPNVTGSLLSALVLMGLGSWILGRWSAPARPPRTRWLARALCLLLCLGPGVWAYQQAHAARTGESSEAEISWIEFDAARLAELRSAGTPVFIDFTAAWCLSCQANKAAFKSAAVRDRFTELGLVALRADWTKRDETIARALATYGRSSVPLYVLYSGEPDSEPVILPQLLTPGTIISALAKLDEDQ